MWDIEIIRLHTKKIDDVRRSLRDLTSMIERGYGVTGCWAGPDNFVADLSEHVDQAQLKISGDNVWIRINFAYPGGIAKLGIRRRIEQELDRIL
jgi:hypothetical protein